MNGISMRFCGSSGLIALLVVCLLLPISSAASIPIEQTMSARYSVSSWTSGNIPEPQLLEVLHDAYGYWGNHRSVPQVGSDYSLILFVANATGTYKYVPEQNQLIVHDLTVTKETLRPRFNQGYPSDANAVAMIVWDQTKMNNQYYASAEAGLIAQNTYLAAASVGLGTVCVALIDSNGLRSDLKLATTMTPLIVMPLGYPTSPYPSASPNYGLMTGNLPPVQYSSLSFTDTLNNMLYAQIWSQQELSTQELSQLLWAAYGYSSTNHRTVPSANGVYPFKVWFLNSTGTYEYTPQTHSATARLQGDKRLEIANAFGSQTWAASAPTIFLIAYDSSLGGDGGIVPHEWPEVESGAIVQNILLEASAWSLSGNIVSKGLEDWNGNGAAAIRSILSLPSSTIPLYVVPVGHDGAIPEFPLLLIPLLFIITTLAAVAFHQALSRDTTLKRKNSKLSSILKSCRL